MDIKFEEMKVSGNMPSPSGVALGILKLTQREQVEVDEIVHLIKADPVLTGRLLKIVNSSFYNTSEPILSIKVAVIMLGTDVLSKLALSCSVIDANRSGKCAVFDYEDFWKTALLRAVIMQSLCKQINLIPAEDAFTIGLIADIGKLALAQVYPEDYSKLITSQQGYREHSFCRQCTSRVDCRNDNLDNLLLSERQLFSIDHNQITLWLFSDWGLPEYVFSIGSYFQSRDIDLSSNADLNKRIASALSLSDILAGLDCVDAGIESLKKQAEQLGVEIFDLQGLLEKSFDQFLEWQDVFSLKKETRKVIHQETFSGNDSNNFSNYDRKLTIMVVEDDRIQSHILRNLFIGQGHDVITAESGEAALEKIIYQPVDILVTDYKMQPMDGIALCKALRANDQTKALYCILITADNEPETLRAAFESGVNDFIAKPYKLSELNARMLGAIRAVELANERRQQDDQYRKLATELATTSRRLATVATTDQLTGLPNRRFANTHLDQEWANYVRTGNSFAIYSLDLDHFKQVNDNYGHDIGDQVLIHFSKVLQNTIRVSDIACRMGGEEFIVVSPSTDANNIANLGERICKAVEDNQPIHLKLSRLITVSVGGAFAEKAIDKNGWSDTLKRSDQALYNAKYSGRNQFKYSQTNNNRKDERQACQLIVKVCRINDQKPVDFEAKAVNFSRSGMFLKCDQDCVPLLNEIVTLFIPIDGQLKSHISKVVRIEASGFAVYFSKYNQG